MGDAAQNLPPDEKAIRKSITVLDQAIKSFEQQKAQLLALLPKRRKENENRNFEPVSAVTKHEIARLAKDRKRYGKSALKKGL